MDKATAKAIVQSITLGTLIQRGCNGRWSKPAPVGEVYFRHESNYRGEASVGIYTADVDDLRDGKVWGWLGFSVTESDLLDGSVRVVGQVAVADLPPGAVRQ